MFGGSLLVREGLDPDARSYIAAVELADGQPLERGVKKAINSFVVGCKSDGTWDAIKASCILAGAKTLAGALVPLVGTAPTNFNFVDGDYNRKTGLKGNGVNKYLNSNYAFPASLQDNCHISHYYTKLGVNGTVGGFGNYGASGSYLLPAGSRLYQSSALTFFPSDVTTIGFRGISRNNNVNYLYRRAGLSEPASAPSLEVTHGNLAIFARQRPSTVDVFSDHRGTIYTIGESLDLAKLDARVTALMDAFSLYIP